MKLEQYLLEIEKFLTSYLEKTKMNGYVLGLSGGVDSSLLAAIALKAVGKDKLFVYNLPIYSGGSTKEDKNYAYLLAHELGLDLITIDLSESFKSIQETITKNIKTESNKGSIANSQARLRMLTLYQIAQDKNALVLGTDNMDESYIGYFTKYGDGGVDLLPLVYLTKSEVRKAARMYGLSEKIANRVPTAALYLGQSDEEELGFSYDVLDDYLLGKDIDVTKKDRIEYLHKISAHKREAIPRPMPFNRDN